MSVRSAAVLALVLALAGCLAPEAPAAESLSTGALAPTPSDAASTPASPGEAPVWAVGDAWAIESHGADADEASFVVVVAATADAYTLATTSPDTAGFDAVFDISYIGPIRARDLAGAQKGEPVRFFDFPLADGKTWTTLWDGIEVALTAKATASGFDIEGVTPEGAPYVRYTYAPELRWWSEIEFEAGYGLTVTKRIEGWTGTVAAATAEALYDERTSLPVASPFVGSFTVDEGQTGVLFTLEGGGSAYARALQFVPPDGSPYMSRTPNSEVAGSPRWAFTTERLPPLPGTWGIVSPAAHAADGAFHLTIHQVAVTTTPFR